MNDKQNDSIPLLEIAGFAQELATASREIAMRNFRHPLTVDTKADESPVTLADRQVEQGLRDAIARRYPQHGILGEEFGRSHADADYVWSIDPIDGTRSFISGNPLWGTLLAVLYCGRPVVGLIDIPATSERWVGIDRHDTTFAGKRCHTRSTPSLHQAILYATDPDIFKGAERQAFESLSRSVYLRRFGGDCYSYGLLASGHIDLVMEAGLQPYDFLAMAPIITEAGGTITDWQGRVLTMRSSGQVLASANAVLHQQALARINA